MDKRKHKCSWCNKRFAGSSDLKRHCRIHTGEKAFKCDVCGKSFSCSSHLVVHKRIHTGEKPYECTTCNKSFTQKSSLNCHKRIHTGETPFVCGKCGKAFKKKHHLVCHNRTHSGFKPYTCPTCGKKFSQCGGLTSHKWTHTGEKLFECNICGKKYQQASGLIKHKKTHIKEAFTCNICDKQFSQTSNLLKHKITHSGGRYFDCNIPIRNVLPSRIFSDKKRPHAAVNLFKFDICVKVTKESCSDFRSKKGLPKPQTAFTTSELFTGHKEFHTRQQRRDIGTHEQVEHCLDDEIDTRKEPFSGGSHETAPALSQDELYQCDLCGRIFASSELLTLHKEFHTGQKLNDVASHEHLQNAFHLDSEIKADKPSGITYICADCDEEFELVDELFKHSEMAHVISTF